MQEGMPLFFEKSRKLKAEDYITDENRGAALAAGAVAVSQQELAIIARRLAKPALREATENPSP